MTGLYLSRVHGATSTRISDRAPSEQEELLPFDGGHQGDARGDDGQGGAGRADPVAVVLLIAVVAGIAFYNQR